MRIFLILIMSTMMVGCSSRPEEARASTLREIIENQIRENIRESHGEAAGQCYSWDDFDRDFTRNKLSEQIVTLLRTNGQFLAAVEKIRSMTPDERDAYLKRCRLPLRKTWAELGEISSRGTTDAGRKGELAIANTITDLAQKLLGETAKPSPPQRGTL